jgi:ketosteroid isomerase-like protein
MSQEDVKVVQASFDAWNAGDTDAYRALLDPEVVAEGFPNWPEPGPYVGREATLREFARVREALDTADLADPIGDIIEVGDRVVARFAWRGRGRGPAIDVGMSCVYTLRDGKILHFEFFWDHTEALKAADQASRAVTSAQDEAGQSIA